MTENSFVVSRGWGLAPAVLCGLLLAVGCAKGAGDPTEGDAAVPPSSGGTGATAATGGKGGTGGTSAPSGGSGGTVAPRLDAGTDAAMDAGSPVPDAGTDAGGVDTAVADPCDMDGTKNGNETDIDCGGVDCPGCDTGDDCVLNSDCESLNCNPAAPKTCLAPTCMDNRRNGDETDIDCGGSTTCPDCPPGDLCEVDADCANGPCESGTCGCTPATTDDCSSAVCGTVPDGCGDTFSCPDNCAASGATCVGGACCTPKTVCDALECGSAVSDGCGGTIDCSANTCVAPATCQADGTCRDVPECVEGSCPVCAGARCCKDQYTCGCRGLWFLPCN